MRKLLPMIFPLLLLLASACSEEKPASAEAPRIRVDSMEVFLEPATHSLSSPFQLDVMPDGRVAVLDPDLFRAGIYYPDGRVDFHIGREGRGPGEFIAPRGLHVSASYINVIDPATRLVSQYNHQGTFVTNFVFDRYSYFGSAAVGARREYRVPANGRNGALIRFHDTESDSIRLFGDPLAENPPPVSDAERFRDDIADGEVPAAIRNDLLMEHHGGSLYAVFRNVPLLRRYSNGTLVWEREIDLPVNEVIRTRFMESFGGSGGNTFGELRYVADIAVTDRAVYLLWNAEEQHPQQVLQFSHDGEMQRICELHPGNGDRFNAIGVDEQRGRVYLLNSNEAEILLFSIPAAE